MTFPDFYIVGAPKCGTTALFTYLQNHPQVFFPSFKEPNYFLTDLPNVRHYPTDERYLSLYRHAPPSARRGDASVWNLFSTTAAQEIHARRPDARIVILLRNPVDAALSLHNHSIALLLEDIDDFAEAWAAQDERRAGQRLPFYCPHPELVIYRDVYLYAEQVKRYLTQFGPEQVMVVLFDDFIADPRNVTEAVVRHVGLSATDLPDTTFQPVNAALTLRSRFLMDMLRAPPKPLGPLILAGKRIANSVGIKPVGLMLKYFSKPIVKPTISVHQRAAYTSTFAEDLRQLEVLIGRDLSAWRMEPPMAGAA